MKRAVDLTEESDESGSPAGLPGPGSDGILLWAGFPGPAVTSRSGILAGQDQRALLRSGGQNGPWDHPDSVHHGTTSGTCTS